jgi:acyl-CoA thioesterase FadM
LRIYESGRDVQKLCFAATSKAAPKSHMMPAYQRRRFLSVSRTAILPGSSYARYFEMINGVVEDWFEDALEASFSGLLFHRNLATPTVHFNVDFTGRSMMGDRLTFETSVTRFGTSSFDLCHQVSCRGELRMRAYQTLLFTRLQRQRIATPFRLT